MKDDNLHCNDKFNLFLLLGPVLTGISIFVVLSALLIPLRIKIPIPIVMSFLTFFLTKYYFSSNYHKKDYQINNTQVDKIDRNYVFFDTSFSKFLFIIIYCIFLAITFFTSYNPDIFAPWSEFTFVDAMKLTSAIGLSFFIPGYAIVSIISRHNQLENVLKYILGYFISVLITGIIAYVTAAFGFPVSENRNFLLLIYSTILLSYTALNFSEIFKRNLFNFSHRKSVNYRLISQSGNFTVLMVFLSLFSIIIILTYYLYNGTIIGDQWFHHGKALAFISGAFKDIESTAPDYYPPLFSALMSEFLVISGIPSVNAFLSVNFLIMLPILTFYFFVKKWLPNGQNRSALIATALFTLASGFGWVYGLQLATSEHLFSQNTILEIFRIATLKSFDLNLANTFFATPHPSPHGIIALPAGFLLLSLLKINLSSKLKFALIFLVTTVGIMSHDEFYLFILISSSLLVIYQLNKTHIIFMSFLSSIVFVFLVDMFLPVKYYTLTEISGFPLIWLTFGFVLAAWGMYAIHLRSTLGKMRFKLQGKLVLDRRTSFIVATVIVSVVLYLYFFTFVVWDNLTVEQVRIQTDNYGQRDIPWYLFPMKLGIAGFLGLLFILSYLYKKFETEIFVFGVIAIFAFLLAPYYDEYRFGKYIMVAMVGFASLLIYKIVCYIQTIKLNKLVGGVFLGVIITTASLSLLMYTGFKDILSDNPDYRLIPGENNRFFPTNPEMKFFTTLKNNIVNLKTDNIAVLNNDSGNGLLSEKLMAFVGIPNQKIYHNPLILNASSLPALFQFLDSNDIRYLIIPQKDLKNTTNYTYATRFLLANFPTIYQDSNYSVFKVPDLIGPSPSPNAALILDQTSQLPASKPYPTLQYDIGSSGVNETGHEVIEKNGNVILSNNETKPTSVWSNLENKTINFIETEFRINRENIPMNKLEIQWKNDSSYIQQMRSAQYPKNNLGIRWDDNQSEYSVLLTPKGLQLSTKKINGTEEASIMQNQEILKEPGKWYNIKILLLAKEIIILVNDQPRMQISRGAGDYTNSNISRLGAVVHGNDAEFLPIKAKQVPGLDNLYYSNLNNIYYVLSFLAMSKANYGVFLTPDLSNSMTIILPFDPTNMSADNFNIYLEHVRMGGTIVIFNSADSVDGIFSRFLSLNSTNLFSEFSKISYPYDNHNNDISMPGKARVLKVPFENDLKAISFYNDKLNKKISPFAIEKIFPSGGKIIYVNNAGLFNSISNSKSNFLELSNVTNLLNNTAKGGTLFTSSDKIKPRHEFSQIEKFIGLMELNGKININSSSLIAYNQLNSPENLNFHANKLVLSDSMKKIKFENVTLNGLKFYGNYTAELNSSGFMTMPSSNSFYDYIDFRAPIEAPIKIKVDSKQAGGAEISLTNQSKINTFNFTDDFEIDIQQGYGNRANDTLNFLIKNPKIKFTGNAIIDSPNFSNFPLSGSRYLKINGTMSSVFDHVDDYYGKNDKLEETRYITYLNGVNITGKTNPYVEKLGIMGDLSYRARNHDVSIPLQEIFTSTQNILLIISVIAISFFVSSLIWRNRLFWRVDKR